MEDLQPSMSGGSPFWAVSSGGSEHGHLYPYTLLVNRPLPQRLINMCKTEKKESCTVFWVQPALVMRLVFYSPCSEELTVVFCGTWVSSHHISPHHSYGPFIAHGWFMTRSDLSKDHEGWFWRCGQVEEAFRGAIVHQIQYLIIESSFYYHNCNFGVLDKPKSFGQLLAKVMLIHSSSSLMLWSSLYLGRS